MAAFVGFLMARGYQHYKSVYKRRVVKWFWVPNDSARIYLYCGMWRDKLTDFGEVEPLLNLQDALTLGELRGFLQSYYKDVEIVTETNSIDWRFPVVSLGGPLPNPLTAEIGKRDLIPIWFLDAPYSQHSERAIGTKEKDVVFKSKFGDTGHLKSDVGFVARIRSPENGQQVVFVIASNYGVGNLGVVKFITSSEKLTQLSRANLDRHFQVVISSHIAGDDTILDTELMYCRSLN
ncbi:MAG TPA: hypothetical protein VIT19_04610 [Pyrinomonadaceae bacterium]